MRRGASAPRRPLVGAVAAFVAIATWSPCEPRAHAATSGREFAIGDYFQIQRIRELELSPDGKTLAFAVETPALAENRLLRGVFLLRLDSGEPPQRLDDLSDARRLAWTDDARRLAFISDRTGISQVFAYELATRRLQQMTRAAEPVTQFAFAPDRERLAYSTRPRSRSSSLFERFHRANRGQLVHIARTSVFDFIDPAATDWPPATSPRLWLMRSDGTAESLAIPGEPADFHWSSDGDFLSVTYVGDDIPPSLLRAYRTSVGIFDLAARSFRPMAQAYPQAAGESGRIFIGGEWVPGEHKMLLRRVDETDPWVSRAYPRWTILEMTWKSSDPEPPWHSAETYDSRFFPVGAATVLVESTVRARRSLFEWTSKGARPAALSTGLSGSSSLFSFDRGMQTIAFVNESANRPPEIFISNKGRAAVDRVTRLNSAIAAKRLPQVQEIEWRGTDGMSVSGWLLLPEAARFRKPWPLITYAHGGPGLAFTDTFAPNFAESLWPYPFEVYALHGMAVFIPNYRGTGSFGRAFSSPSKVDGEPVADIVSGVRQLIASGVADSAKLGISGHSHGAWLGPLALVRTGMFSASSFAEGTPNLIVNYELMSTWLNREVHDVIIGNPYEALERYAIMSPGLHFDGIKSANLFEGGAFSEALFMLGYAKASQRFSGPTEFVVYPRTGHNISIPRMQEESAQRNLDWFAFWLKSKEQEGPEKAEQYRRWKVMLADSRRDAN